MDQPRLRCASSIESKVIIINENSFEEIVLKSGAGAVDKVMEELQEHAISESESKGEPRCSDKESNNDADVNSISNDGLTDIVEQSLSIALDCSLQLVNVNGANTATDETQNLDDNDARADSATNGVPNDDGSNENETETDPDWHSDDSEYTVGSGSDSEEYEGYEYGDNFDSGSDPMEDDDLEDFELNDSIRDAVLNEIIGSNSVSSIFKSRASVSDDALDKCPICLAHFVDEEHVRRLPCFHSFHTGCVDPWLKHHQMVCPSCRMNIKNSGDYLNEGARLVP